jgi:hypothetical protein
MTARIAAALPGAARGWCGLDALVADRMQEFLVVLVAVAPIAPIAGRVGVARRGALDRPLLGLVLLGDAKAELAQVRVAGDVLDELGEDLFMEQ